MGLVALGSGLSFMGLLFDLALVCTHDQVWRDKRWNKKFMALQTLALSKLFPGMMCESLGSCCGMVALWAHTLASSWTFSIAILSAGLLIMHGDPQGLCAKWADQLRGLSIEGVCESAGSKPYTNFREPNRKYSQKVMLCLASSGAWIFQNRLASSRWCLALGHRA